MSGIYLGLRIDENLEHKLACTVGILNKLKCYFPKEILLQLYHAFIYPHLYAIPIWVVPINLISTKFLFSKTKPLKLLP